MPHRVLAFRILASFLVPLLAARIAHADDPPAPRATGAFESARGTPAPTTDDTRFRLQLGFTATTGNTRSVGLNTATRFALRRGIHQLTIDGAISFGLSWNLPTMLPAMLPPGGVDALRVQNVVAQQLLLRARYDIFVTDNNAFYVAPQAFHDLPAGFNSRLSLQFGYARNFVSQPTLRRFFGEIGMDLTYENTTQPAIPGQMAIMGVSAYERFMPQARLFLGFEEKANRAFELTLGVEALMDVTRPSNFRMNNTLAISSRVSDWFSLGLSTTLRFVNEPVPLRADPIPANQINRDPFDLTTLFTMTFNFVPATPPPCPPPPPPPPPCPQCPTCPPAAASPESPPDVTPTPSVAPASPT